MDWIKNFIHGFSAFLTTTMPMIKVNIEALKKAGLRDSVKRLLDKGIRSFAVCFLWSFVNPQHERRAKEIVLELCPEALVREIVEQVSHSLSRMTDQQQAEVLKKVFGTDAIRGAVIALGMIRSRRSITTHGTRIATRSASASPNL